MAYVALSEIVGRFPFRGRGGANAHLDLSVFAGEVVSITASPRRERRSPAGRGPKRLVLRSATHEKKFDFRALPDVVDIGDVVGVVAALAPDAAHGPIVGLANLDTEERVDLVWREKEILKLLDGGARDYRRGGALWRGVAAAAAKTAFLTALAATAATIWAIGPSAFAEPPVFIDAATTGAPLAITLATALAGFCFFNVSSLVKISRKAHRQRLMLAAFWRSAGAALLEAADVKDAFRASEGVRVKRQAQKLLPPPRETLKPAVQARGAPAEDAVASAALAYWETEDARRASAQSSAPAARWTDRPFEAGRAYGDRDGPSSPHRAPSRAAQRPPSRRRLIPAENDGADRGDAPSPYDDAWSREPGFSADHRAAGGPHSRPERARARLRAR